MDTTRQEDLILVSALVGFSRDYEPVNVELADKAYEMAEEIAAENGLTMEEAIKQLDLRGTSWNDHQH